jgi:MoaA/NifB/PqqE/SkfB family radical SAM enzyme
VLFGPSVAQRLFGAGVSSVSVSLDGATAATNDAIREGGRWGDVVTRLRDVLAWRRGERADLRVGLSYVVLAQNVRELDAFVDLGAELGVDWIKLEEGVPATEFARRSLVSCAAAEVRSAIDTALARGRSRGLVMVDHTRDRALFRCKLDDDARAFLEADEHANRSVIHPCRTPWDTACIEPNGDVRVLDFFGPIAGNVLRTPLAQLWNNREARDARERSRRARICGAGPVTCL